MKRKIPVFSVVCFLNVALYLVNRNLSLHMVFPLALGIMALLVETKPEMKMYAGYVALCWGVLKGVNILRALPGLFRAFNEYTPAYIASLIYGTVCCVFVLVAAYNLLAKKKEKTTGAAYFLIGLGLTFGYMVVIVLKEVALGNNGIFYVFISSFRQTLPNLTSFGAIAMLYSAFAEPEVTPIMNKEKIRILVFLVVVTAVLLTIGYIMSDSTGGSDYYYSGSSGKKYDSVSDYIKDRDPDLYDSIVDRYNSLTP